jgi:hypothetical protein
VSRTSFAARRRAGPSSAKRFSAEFQRLPPLRIGLRPFRGAETAWIPADSRRVPRRVLSSSLAYPGGILSVSLSESPCVRVHRTSDGALLGEAMVPGQRAIAWLDASRLLIGGDALTVWLVRGGIG